MASICRRIKTILFNRLIPTRSILRITKFLALLIALLLTLLYAALLVKMLGKVDDETVSCRVPNLDPFDPTIGKIISEMPKPLECHESDEFPLLFNSSVDPYPRLIPVKTLQQMQDIGVIKCFYQQAVRGGSGENRLDVDFSLDKTNRHQVNLDTETKIPSEYQFIALTCETLKLVSPNSPDESEYIKLIRPVVDMHAFVNYNGTVVNMRKSAIDKLNVIVLGIDSVSRMGFIRSMPESYRYLMEEMGGVEMRGYHKIGDNTFPNIGPMLTNLPVWNGSTLACEINKKFDNCPFIWKRYSTAGYKTLFAEDEKHLAIFNFLKNGFTQPPTDYYFRPFVSAADSLVGHDKEFFISACFGPRPAFQVMLDYMQKMSLVMRRQRTNYFQFGWSTSVTHGRVNGGSLVDQYFRDALQWWKEGDYLNDTVLILMSDHGVRFGEIHNYYQGQLEDKLPFMYVVMPTAFQEKYPRAWKNLKKNQDRLVTSVDLHQTLGDILNLFTIENDKIHNREKDLSPSWKHSAGELSTGVSLFLPIPKKRTCEMAGIEMMYCTCNHHVKWLSVLDDWVQLTAKFAVTTINSIISEFTQCAVLSLSKIFQAGQVSFTDIVEDMSEPIGHWEAYQLTFQTIPGDATFEAFILWDGMGSWNVSGEIGRTNLYGNQSHCVDDKRAKLYCYCLDLIE